MHKLLLLTGLFIMTSLSIAFSQAPSSISYQAVACDADGNELISQKVSIRASILQGSANGTLVYQEAHSTPSLVTDEYGLFTIEVGRGAIQPGSPANTLTEINWGTGTYWLRVEMDILGGANYQLVGANQILTVPYAFFATEAGKAQTADVAIRAGRADTASYVPPSTPIFNAMNSDSAAYADVAGNALSANFSDDAGNAEMADTAQYALLAGLAFNADFSTEAGHAEQSDTAQYAFLAGLALNADFSTEAGHAEQSDTAQYAFNAGNAQNAVDAQNAVFATNAQHANLSDTSLYAYNAGHASTADDAITAQMAVQAQTALDDADRDPMNELQGLKYDSTGKLSIVPVSQGGTSVSIDFVQNFQGPGSSHEFPEGINGEYLVIPDQYTVPVGKHFYMTSGGENVYLPVYQSNHPNAPTMPVFPESTIITNCKCTGILIEKSGVVDVEILNFNNFSGNEYTVPQGKVFILKSGLPINNSRLLIKAPNTNSFVLFELANAPFDAAVKMPSFPAGTVIKKPDTLPNLIATGLLIDTF